jgi:Nucleotidyl transferase AbiEii toxin, Type IV TA system
MRLYEHPDFRDALVAAGAHFATRGISAQLIEKDYYVTEALRSIAAGWEQQVIFKGGTSLSKGWQLIDRFSEDIDLFLDKTAFTPTLGANRVDRELAAIETAVSLHPGLSVVNELGNRKRGTSRNSYFDYSSMFQGDETISLVAPQILLEMGTRSGNYPTQIVRLSSYLVDFLQAISESLDTDDETDFPMLLLDFRRTAIEKLFAIHNRVEQYLRQGVLLGKYTRHYYDLYCLFQQQEVRDCIASDEYQGLKLDCDKVSRGSFGDSYAPPLEMTFQHSLALFPDAELESYLSREYEAQCRPLCYGRFPSWAEVSGCFESLRSFL